MGVRYLGPARAEAFNAPGMGATYEFGTRRIVLPRFPYSVVYEVHADHIVIVAVAHQRRRPGYWRDRWGGSS